MSFDPTYGVSFTSTTHSKAEGPTLPENNTSSNFVVVVTGAGKGLGYNISLAYARAGISGIAISSRTQADLDNLSEELRQVNPKLEILSSITDTTKPEDVKKLAASVKEKWNGRLDVVVANAGIISKYIYDRDEKTGEKKNRRLPIGIVEDDDAGRVLDINLKGTWNTAQEFTPLLTAKENQSSVRAFVVITSLASHFAHSELTTVSYNVSKIAVNRLVEHLWNDHGKENQYGLQSFSIHPGAVLTPQTEGHNRFEGDVWDECKSSDVENPREWSV
ncbi:hypothetical protein LTR84_006752 [Exophiala bonariae]|uniref:NAD(P)-binding protein n=1 Tax=Exophiala bonariae TaxID=1690606 RepID=A0AAV9MZS8_9EURO|nr:hypothetical protein LTR84_006752 [Exophiala bonariae]